jgi:hypothetical protein
MINNKSRRTAGDGICLASCILQQNIKSLTFRIRIVVDGYAVRDAAGHAVGPGSILG